MSPHVVFSGNTQPGVIESYNSTSRNLDGLLNSDSLFFQRLTGQIYPTVIQINKANSFNTEAPFSELVLFITNDII